MNFVPIPHLTTNENFHLLTKHHMLQNVIHVLTMHPFSWTCHHRDKIHVNSSWKISYCHFILFMIFKWPWGDAVDPLIHILEEEWRWAQMQYLLLEFNQPPTYWIESLKIIGCQIFLLLWIVNQPSRFNGILIKKNLPSLKRFWRKHFYCLPKKNSIFPNVQPCFEWN